jgi:hypothetical protein
VLIVSGNKTVTRWDRVAAAACTDAQLRRAPPAGSAYVGHLTKFDLLPAHMSLSACCRRASSTPFFSIDPAAANLTAVLAPAAAGLNAAAGVLEAALGRRLFAFRLESAALPACAAGSGPCAVWEPSSGRLLLDSGLAARMAEAAGADASVEAALQAEGPEGQAVSGSGGVAGTAAGGGSAGLSALLAAFVERLAEHVAPAAGLMQSGQVRLASLQLMHTGLLRDLAGPALGMQCQPCLLSLPAPLMHPALLQFNSVECPLYSPAGLPY